MSETTKQCGHRSSLKGIVLKWTILYSLFAARLVPNRTEPVLVSGGLVQGLISPEGLHVAYYGIPYATVQKRFESAVPDPKWAGVLQAQNENIRCTQRFFNDPILVLGTEDCLTLNVYTPIKESEKPRPVMVFIHGGGFRQGSGSPYIYGPDYFLRHDIILVTMNYRVDVLGFLCLGIKEASGNVGLKDQVEALRWVRKNIKSFGGDSDNVTVFGESAGAASVFYHLISPMSEGLFERVIIQSGTGLTPWAFQNDPVKFAHKFAKKLGQDKEDLQELLKILKDKSDEELINTVVPRVAGEIALAEYNFVPCLEAEIPGVERFLPEHPYDLLSKGKYAKVPIIIGYNDEEGYWFVSKDNDTMLSTFDFTSSIPRNLKFSSVNEKHKVGNELKSHYLPDKDISVKTKIEFSRYLGDVALIFPVVWTIEEFLKTSLHPVFAYKFTHDGRLNFMKTLSGFRKHPGAAHADELFYMFKTNIPVAVPSSDRDMINKMTTMWTNFAKYSDPTPVQSPLLPVKWVPASKSNQTVLVLDNELSYTQLYENDKLKYWKSLYAKHLRK